MMCIVGTSLHMICIVGTPLHYIPRPRDAIDVSYRLPANPHGAFRVHPLSGVLFLSQSIDAEKTYQTKLEVHLTAKYSERERSEAIIEFQITVRDENDNAPVFATPIEKPLPEDSGVGKSITN